MVWLMFVTQKFLMVEKTKKLVAYTLLQCIFLLNQKHAQSLDVNIESRALWDIFALSSKTDREAKLN